MDTTKVAAAAVVGLLLCVVVVSATKEIDACYHIWSKHPNDCGAVQRSAACFEKIQTSDKHVQAHKDYFINYFQPWLTTCKSAAAGVAATTTTTTAPTTSVVHSATKKDIQACYLIWSKQPNDCGAVQRSAACFEKIQTSDKHVQAHKDYFINYFQPWLTTCKSSSSDE